MPSPELRESREIEPEESPDVRAAWGNWTEAGEVQRPDHAEDKETRIVQDIQDGHPADNTATDNTHDAIDDDLLPEGVIYDREAETAAKRRDAAPDVGKIALEPVADIPQQELGRLPLDDQDIIDRTTENRVNLADDVPAVDLKPTYGGYLDVVMHGDAAGTEAHVHGEVTEFSLEDTAQMVEQTPGWEHRPVRLLSCSTGQETYAKELANRLDVPVYAPSDVLTVHPDGSTEIENGGHWRRFEPDAR
jgi:hypothetical protein